MQLRQVHRGVVVRGAAPGVGVVMALMARALRCGGALLLRACVVPPPDGDATANNCKSSGELEQLSGAPCCCSNVLWLARTNTPAAAELRSRFARVVQLQTADVFTRAASLPTRARRRIRETDARVPRLCLSSRCLAILTPETATRGPPRSDAPARARAGPDVQASTTPSSFVQ